MANTPDSYSGGPGFYSRPGEWLCFKTNSQASTLHNSGPRGSLRSYFSIPDTALGKRNIFVRNNLPLQKVVRCINDLSHPVTLVFGYYTLVYRSVLSLLSMSFCGVKLESLPNLSNFGTLPYEISTWFSTHQTIRKERMKYDNNVLTPTKYVLEMDEILYRYYVGHCPDFNPNCLY
jgi:hypothetical protein